MQLNHPKPLALAQDRCPAAARSALGSREYLKRLVRPAPAAKVQLRTMRALAAAMAAAAAAAAPSEGGRTLPSFEIAGHLLPSWWSDADDARLLRGVAKYGCGAWKNTVAQTLFDDEFGFAAIMREQGAEIVSIESDTDEREQDRLAAVKRHQEEQRRQQLQRQSGKEERLEKESSAKPPPPSAADDGKGDIKPPPQAAGLPSAQKIKDLTTMLVRRIQFLVQRLTGPPPGFGAPPPTAQGDKPKE